MPSWVKNAWEKVVIPLLNTVTVKNVAVNAVVAAITFAGTLWFGGTNTVTITDLKGNVYEVTADVPEGADDLIKDCNFKEVNDECFPKIGAKVVWVEKGEKAVKPVKVEDKKKDLKKPDINVPVKKLETPDKTEKSDIDVKEKK